MTEYWHERVMSALETELREITSDGGATYWYTPTVVRAADIESEAILLRKYDTIYALAPFEVEIAELAGQQHDETLVVDFLVATRFTTLDEPFKQKAPTRWTLQTRVFGDFLQKILSNVTLDGLVTNINFRNVSFDAAATMVQEYACVIGQIAPTHNLGSAAPGAS